LLSDYHLGDYRFCGDREVETDVTRWTQGTDLYQFIIENLV